MADYIPAPDAEFKGWQQNFVAYANPVLGLALDTPLADRRR